MSRFYGSMQGNRGEATRQGTKKSGFYAHIRGWNVGVVVTLYVDENDKDCCRVSLTGGSNYPISVKDLGTFREGEVTNEH